MLVSSSGYFPAVLSYRVVCAGMLCLPIPSMCFPSSRLLSPFRPRSWSISRSFGGLLPRESPILLYRPSFRPTLCAPFSGPPILDSPLLVFPLRLSSSLSPFLACCLSFSFLSSRPIGTDFRRFSTLEFHLCFSSS